MRRRSERKKSTEVSSPVVARRSRRRKSVSVEKSGECGELIEEAVATKNRSRGTSEEHSSEKNTLRLRNSSKRTKINEQDPQKPNNYQDSENPEHRNIDAILEEGEGEGVVEKPTKNNAEEILANENSSSGGINTYDSEGEKQKDSNEHPNEKEVLENVVGGEETLTQTAESGKEIDMIEEASKIADVLDIKEDSRKFGLDANNDDDVNLELGNVSKQDTNEGKISKQAMTAIIRGADDHEEKLQNLPISQKENSQNDSNDKNMEKMDTTCNQQENVNDINENVAVKKSENETVRRRKRKWLTKRRESQNPVMAISTDSLKGLLADVQLVPLSDVRLDSSPEVQVLSEREEGEETPTPEKHHENQLESLQRTLEKLPVKINQKESIPVPVSVAQATSTPIVAVPNSTGIQLPHSPSPPRNKTSNVLYITNLVRPFTVLQLKGLLARTGKIVEGGFWIDRIKSKCYVEYETEDEAIETRHALHGVRWPVSNPKCLNVDFGSKTDMERAIDSTKEEGPKISQDNKNVVIIESGWNHGERNENTDRKINRPIREWDLGKKENLDREKTRESVKQCREHERQRDRFRNRDNDRESKAPIRGRGRSRSLSPSEISNQHKIIKKENEPPLRLLDDLFRKTKATPSVYWLPLTPEQIAEKETFRQKRIQEHQERVKQRELQREKERLKDRIRGNDRQRERDRDRRRSSDRKRSSSRDKKRY